TPDQKHPNHSTTPGTSTGKPQKNTRNNPYPIQEKSQTTAFLPKRYEEADQNGLQHFPQPFSENRSARD
uniref:hypothetical protein n=1 Tax=Alistipes putredinis TaxID=28117 RepID=UPI003FD8A946